MHQPAEIERETQAAIVLSLAENYQLQATLTRLPGENMNYLACISSHRKYVVKIAADDQSESFVEMEYLALKHARKRLPGIRIPSIIENRFGNAETFLSTSDNSLKRLRLIEYLDGVSLEGIDISDNIRRNVGISLARFDQAMKEFDHPAAHRNHRWDLTQARQHERAMELVNDTQNAQLLGWAFACYKKINTGKLKQVKWQFIHGDANPENILMQDDQVIGLLDFGDSCHNPRICELAICLPYLMMDQPDPLAAAKPVIEGYESISPLTELELELLWPLVLGRIATTISVATKRRQLDSNHPNWFVSEARAWQLLGQLRDLPDFPL
ncbi:MAG: phosphotransferase [Xanthomonadales bacterium]|nr:phosphotransferase [Xanthomonadales bacterium]